MKEKILVSACFLEKGFKYNGKDNYNESIKALQNEFDFVLICPECFGGLTVPRLPSEIIGDKVVNSEGIDVTINFIMGAKKALELAQKNNCKYALLKANSPSCGNKDIYDGTFSGIKIEGEGITTKLLKENGIKVFNEYEIDKLKKEMI